MGDNVELLIVFLDIMFYLVDRILVLIICPSVSERGDNVKFLVIKIFSIVMEC